MRPGVLVAEEFFERYEVHSRQKKGCTECLRDLNLGVSEYFLDTAQGPDEEEAEEAAAAVELPAVVHPKPGPVRGESARMRCRSCVDCW